MPIEKTSRKGVCVTCGEPLRVVPGLGLVGDGGVCRDETNPMGYEGFDNEGLHIFVSA